MRVVIVKSLDIEDDSEEDLIEMVTRMGDFLRKDEADRRNRGEAPLPMEGFGLFHIATGESADKILKVING